MCRCDASAPVSRRRAGGGRASAPRGDGLRRTGRCGSGQLIGPVRPRPAGTREARPRGPLAGL